MTDNDFRQFNGAFDSAIQPEDAFAERLRKSMATESRPEVPPIRQTITASPSRKAIEAVPDRRSHPLFIAAAVLVMIALAAASIVQLAPRVIEPQYASNSIATLPADANVTPGPDVLLQSQLLPGIGSVSYHHVRQDNLVAVTYMRQSGALELVSYDLTSNAVLWQTDVSQSDHFVFGDSVVVGLSYTHRDSAEGNALPEFDEMVVFDIRTGEQLWAKSIADWKMEHGWEFMQVAGDSVLFVRGGEVIALDAHTGERTWTAEYDLAEPQEENWVQSPALAEMNGELYLMQVDGSVEVLDLATGESIREFAMPATFQDAHPVSLQLFPVPTGLLVAADTFIGSGARTTLMVINPDTGDVVWERSVNESGPIDVAPDGSIAIARHTWEYPPLLMRLLGQDGHSTSALTWLDADGEVILETDRVRVPDMGGLVVTGNGELICGTTEQFACFDRSGTRYVLDASNVWDAVWVGEDLLVMTERGMMRVDLP